MLAQSQPETGPETGVLCTYSVSRLRNCTEMAKVGRPSGALTPSKCFANCAWTHLPPNSPIAELAYRPPHFQTEPATLPQAYLPPVHLGTC
jgi:hypothetical protein